MRQRRPRTRCGQPPEQNNGAILCLQGADRRARSGATLPCLASAPDPGQPGPGRLAVALLYPTTSHDVTLAKAGAAWITERGRRPPGDEPAGRPGTRPTPPGWLATLDA